MNYLHTPDKYYRKSKSTIDEMAATMTADTDAPALEVAHERYVTMLCALNRLRCHRDARSSADYGARLVEARRHAKEAYAEWFMLTQLNAGATR
jgi:hypothetical protein